MCLPKRKGLSEMSLTVCCESLSYNDSSSVPQRAGDEFLHADRQTDGFKEGHRQIKTPLERKTIMIVSQRGLSLAVEPSRAEGKTSKSSLLNGEKLLFTFTTSILRLK